MTKQEFVKQVACEFDITQRLAEDISLYVLNSCQRAADRDGRIQVGKHIFTAKDRAARQGRNPSTGDKITIAQKRVTKYKYTG